MTAPSSIDLSGWLSEQLTQASPDLLRQMISTFVQALMGAEADAICGAGYAVRSEQRNTRNGYRGRECDTRAGLTVCRVRHSHAWQRGGGGAGLGADVLDGSRVGVCFPPTSPGAEPHPATVVTSTAAATHNGARRCLLPPGDTTASIDGHLLHRLGNVGIRLPVNAESQRRCGRAPQVPTLETDPRPSASTAYPTRSRCRPGLRVPPLRRWPQAVLITRRDAQPVVRTTVGVAPPT